MFMDICLHKHILIYICTHIHVHCLCFALMGYERWGAGVETQKNVRGEIGGWGRVPLL